MSGLTRQEPPNPPAVLLTSLNKGIDAAMAGDHEEALKAFELLAEAEVARPEIDVLRLGALHALGRWDEVASGVRQLVRSFRRSPVVLLFSVEVHLDAGRFAQARRVLDQVAAMELKPHIERYREVLEYCLRARSAENAECDGHRASER